ncbi:3-oxoacyl-[acyl-carrier-protein] synthase 2 [Serratia rubidaea]|nr:3-oxoacyl-[acyl-carrier-protein] synthase 2 [Serratia rubidaea]
MTQRVVITGMAGITAFGNDWQQIDARLRQGKSAVRYMAQWEAYRGLNARLGAPVEDFTLPEHYTRKRIRSMGRVSLLATRATELALGQAGLLEDAVLTSGATGIAYGSSSGSTDSVSEFATMLTEKHTPQYYRHHLCADDAAHRRGQHRPVLRPARPGDPDLQRLHLRQPGDWLCL